MRSPGRVLAVAVFCAGVITASVLPAGADRCRALGSGAALAQAAATTTTTTIAPPTVAPGVQVRSAITYQVDQGQPELLDAYLPAPSTGPKPPAVVLIHGGGWTTGNRSVLAPEAAQLAAQGFAAFTIDYRLEDDPTDLPWTDPVDDGQAAVLYVSEHADEFGFDRSRIGLLGASAGGWLVAMIATLGTLDDTTGHDPNATPGRAPAPIAVAVTWSGIFDLTTLQPNGSAIPSGCAGDPACITLLTPDGFDDLTGCSLAQCPQAFAQASPITHVSSATTPMDMFNSAEELVPVAQPDGMATALEGAGVTHDVVILPGNLHAQQYALGAWSQTVAFLSAALDLPATTTTTTVSEPVTAPGAAGDDADDEGTDWAVVGAVGGASLFLIVGGIVLVIATRRRRARRVHHRRPGSAEHDDR